MLPELDQNHTCAEAFALIVQSAADQIAANRRAVLETVDPAAAHQLRIGLRRLRSALSAFRPLHDTAALRELEGHAQALARTVGELRDADVLIEHIYAPVAGVMGEPIRACRPCARLCSRTATACASGCGRRSMGSNGRCCSSIWRCGRAPSSAPRHSLGRSRKFARSALKKRWKKVADSGERLDDLTVEQRHQMRKALKTLRYATEFFASLYPEASTRRFIKETRSLQEVFGYLNDVVAAERLGAICHDGCAREPRSPTRRRLHPRLAQRPSHPRLERRPQRLAEARAPAAVLGVRGGHRTGMSSRALCRDPSCRSLRRVLHGYRASVSAGGLATAGPRILCASAGSADHMTGSTLSYARIGVQTA